MDARTLASRVRHYLDAESLLNIRRAGDTDARDQERIVAELRLQVLEALAEGREKKWEAFYENVQTYLNATETFEINRAASKDLDRPARLRERARHELESQLIAVMTDTPTPEPHQRTGPIRLLVALDKSEQADWALRLGTQLASTLHAQMALVHAVPPELGLTESFLAGQTLERLHRKEGEDLLEQAAACVPESVDLQRMLRDGPANEEIVNAAREWGADFIIMGTHARGRVAHFLVGSNAEAVIRLAPCPVITVGQEPHLPEREPAPQSTRKADQHAAAEHVAIAT